MMFYERSLSLRPRSFADPLTHFAFHKQLRDVVKSFDSAFRMKTVCNDAMKASLQLVSKCSNISAHELERLYRNDCMCHSAEDGGEPDPSERSLEEWFNCEALEALREKENKQMQQTLEAIQATVSEEMAGEDEHESSREAPDPDIELIDGPELVETTAADGDGATDVSMFPLTLRECMASQGSMWPKLWQLAMALRVGEHGCDSAFLRKAEEARLLFPMKHAVMCNDTSVFN